MKVGDVYYQAYELSVVPEYPGTAWKLVGQFRSLAEADAALADPDQYPAGSGGYKLVKCEVVR